MENFRKVRTSEQEMPLPFPDLPPDVVEMKVKEGSKIRNLMNFAMAQMELKGRRQIVFSGCGRGSPQHHNQEPSDGPAQNLTVHKNVPSICILLSRDPLDPTQTGYQPPEPLDEAGEDAAGSSAKGLKRLLPPPCEE
ncbi:Ribonuclease P protein subunit p25, partial [Acanthisitta chloris]